MIFDLSGPVNFDQHLDNGASSSTLTLYLKQVTPDPALARHMVFDKSIFRDCDIDSDASGTKVVVNTIPVTRYAVVPLDQPPRLLVTFTPQDTSASGWSHRRLERTAARCVGGTRSVCELIAPRHPLIAASHLSGAGCSDSGKDVSRAQAEKTQHDIGIEPQPP